MSAFTLTLASQMRVWEVSIIFVVDDHRIDNITSSLIVPPKEIKWTTLAALVLFVFAKALGNGVYGMIADVDSLVKVSSDEDSFKC